MTEDEMVDSITDSMDMSLSRLREMVKDKEAWRAAAHVFAESDTTDWATEQQVCSSVALSDGGGALVTKLCPTLATS